MPLDPPPRGKRTSTTSSESPPPTPRTNSAPIRRSKGIRPSRFASVTLRKISQAVHWDSPHWTSSPTMGMLNSFVRSRIRLPSCCSDSASALPALTVLAGAAGVSSRPLGGVSCWTWTAAVGVDPASIVCMAGSSLPEACTRTVVAIAIVNVIAIVPRFRMLLVIFGTLSMSLCLYSSTKETRWHGSVSRSSTTRANAPSELTSMSAIHWPFSAMNKGPIEP